MPILVILSLPVPLSPSSSCFPSFYQQGALGRAVNSSSGVWGEASAAERFGAYLSQTNGSGDNTIVDFESKHLQFSGVSESVISFLTIHQQHRHNIVPLDKKAVE